MGIIDSIVRRFGYIKGTEQAIRLLSDPWERAQGIEAPGGVDQYLKQYGESGWVYVCANRIAKKCAGAGFFLYTKNREGELEELNEHIFLDVLRNPNDMMSEVQLRFLLHLHMELAGEAFWYIPRNEVGGPFQILPLIPHKITVVPGAERLIQGYIYQVGNERVSFEPEEVVHFSYPNPDPDEFFRGASPIKAGTFAIATNQNAERWNYTFFKNSARPEGYLKTDQALENPEVERLRKLWEKHHQGSKQWHKIGVAQRGLEYKEITKSHKDMDFIQQLKMTREQICSIYGVPLSIAMVEQKHGDRSKGIQDEINFALYTIEPTLNLVAAELNAFLLPQFDENLECGFEDVVPRDIELQLKKHETYLEKKVLTINEVREELGLKPVPWGDVPVGEAETPAQVEEGLTREAQNLRKKYRDKFQKLWGTQKGREDEWGAYVGRLNQRERRLKTSLVKFFQELQNQTNEKLRELFQQSALTEELIFDVNVAAETLRAVLVSESRRSLTGEAQYLIDQLDLEFTFDDAAPPVANWTKTRAERFSFEVSQTTAEQLRQTLDDAIREGETLTQMTDRVNGLFRDKKTWEAERIARTECASSSSYGRQEVYNLSEVIDEKEWLTAGDERIRNSHLIDGQVVKKGDEFTLLSGRGTMGPGLSGVAEEDINCRCLSLPRVSALSDAA